MSMPTGGQWPPKPYDQAFATIGEAHDWWEGNPARLSGRYGYQLPKNHPNQFRGGIVGAATRMWMGKPVGVGESADKIHVPLPADICHLSATTLFNEPPTVVLSSDEGEDERGKNLQARIDKLINTQEFASNILVAGEMCAAHGGVYGRAVWDTTLQPEPWIEWVQANQAIPEWRYGKLQAVTFWQALPTDDGKKIYRHLERYIPGGVEHTLFEGKDNELGRPIPLTDHPITAPLAQLVNEDSVITHGTDHLAAVYVPNAKPNVAWMNSGELKHLGRPDLSPDLFPLFDKLNMVYSSLMRDIRLGRARITINAQLLESRGPGGGLGFDVDREIYTAVNDGPDGEPMMQASQFAIRVDEHLAVMDDLTKRILRRAGYSPLSMGMDDVGVTETATEIRAKSRATMNTQKAKGRYFSTAIAYLTKCLVEIDAVLNNTGLWMKHMPSVTIHPVVDETALDIAKTIQALDAARAVSTQTKVQMLHADWEKSLQDAEIDRILKEQGVGVDPLTAATMLGLDGEQPPID